MSRKVGAYVASRRRHRKHGVGVTACCRFWQTWYTRTSVVGLSGSVSPIAKYAVALAIALWPPMTPVRAQQGLMPHAQPATMSKTNLAMRFQQIKNEYAALKDETAQYLPLKQTDTPELKQARLQLGSAIRAYEFQEGQTQLQRDKLNLLTELTETDSLRMQMAMDRMRKLLAIISTQMRKLSGAGGAVVTNTN